VLLEGREDHDLDVRRDVEDLAGGGDSVEAGHPHIHEHEVGAKRAGALDGRAAVSGLADDLDALVAREDGFQARAHEVVVVDEEDPNRRLRHAASSPPWYGRRARTRNAAPSRDASRAPPRSDARSRMPRIP